MVAGLLADVAIPLGAGVLVVPAVAAAVTHSSRPGIRRDMPVAVIDDTGE
jgi:hypothetical protein